MNIEDDYQNIKKEAFHVNKSVEPLLHHRSKQNLDSKSSIKQLLSSSKLLNSLKNHLKNSKRYENSLAYRASKDSYADPLPFEAINLSNVETNDQSTYRAKQNNALNARYSSQRRLQNNSSANTLGMDRHELFESPAYKHPKSKNNLQNYQKSSKFSNVSHRRNMVINMVKAYNVSNFEIPQQNISITHGRNLNEKLEKSKDQNSSRNISKKGIENGLILPNLSKKPSVYDDAIKSVDLKHSNRKDRSLNRLQKQQLNNRTKNIKMTSLQSSPHKGKLPDYSISNKLEQLMNHNVSCVSIFTLIYRICQSQVTQKTQ